MTTLAKLVVKLVTDVSEFEAGMQNASKRMGEIGKGMSAVGDKLTAGVTLPIVAAGVASVKFASDLSESMNKVQVVFGESAGAVMDFSKTSAQALGMSQNSALTALGTFGNLFTSMGIGRDSAADMSVGLTQLAADLASFNNLNPEDVFIKLQSGMVGQAEPLRALGVNLTEAAVKAKAMQMGLGGASGALSEQEKIMARYAIIMDQTANSQGDFARTSDGLANSTRTLKAQVEDTMASFGQVLIPTVEAFLQALTPILQSFNAMPDSTKKVIVNLLLLAAALGPVMSVGGRVVSVVGGLAGLLGSGGGLATAGTFITGTLGPGVVGAFTGIAGAIAAVGAPVWLLIGAILVLVTVLQILGPKAWESAKMLVQIAGVMVQQFGQKMGQIGPEISRALDNAKAWLRNKSVEFYMAGQELVRGLIQGVLSGGQAFIDSLLGIVNNGIAWARRALGIKSPSKVFTDIGKNMMLGMQAGIDEFASKPVLATVQATSAVLPAATAAVRPGGRGAQTISVGPITIHGDLSATAKEQLEQEIRQMFAQSLGEVLEVSG